MRNKKRGKKYIKNKNKQRQKHHTKSVSKYLTCMQLQSQKKRKVNWIEKNLKVYTRKFINLVKEDSRSSANTKQGGYKTGEKLKSLGAKEGQQKQ